MADYDVDERIKSNDTNIAVSNTGSHPIVNFNFMLRVEGMFDVPCKGVRAFTKENEFEYIREGGLNDYVHMKRKPVSKPFTIVVERYAGVDYVDPLALGTELMLPVILMVSNYVNDWFPARRTYTFTGCTVIAKEYGELNAERGGLLTENVTISFREMLVVDILYDSSNPMPSASDNKWSSTRHLTANYSDTRDFLSKYLDKDGKMFDGSVQKHKEETREGIATTEDGLPKLPFTSAYRHLKSDGSVVANETQQRHKEFLAATVSMEDILDENGNETGNKRAINKYASKYFEKDASTGLIAATGTQRHVKVKPTDRDGNEVKDSHPYNSSYISQNSETGNYTFVGKERHARRVDGNGKVIAGKAVWKSKWNIAEGGNKRAAVAPRTGEETEKSRYFIQGADGSVTVTSDMRHVEGPKGNNDKWKSAYITQDKESGEYTNTNKTRAISSSKEGPDDQEFRTQYFVTPPKPGEAGEGSESEPPKSVKRAIVSSVEGPDTQDFRSSYIAQTGENTFVNTGTKKATSSSKEGADEQSFRSQYIRYDKDSKTFQNKGTTKATSSSKKGADEQSFRSQYITYDKDQKKYVNKGNNKANVSSKKGADNQSFRSQYIKQTDKEKFVNVGNKKSDRRSKEGADTQSFRSQYIKQTAKEEFAFVGTNKSDRRSKVGADTQDFRSQYISHDPKAEKYTNVGTQKAKHYSDKTGPDEAYASRYISQDKDSGAHKFEGQKRHAVNENKNADDKKYSSKWNIKSGGTQRHVVAPHTKEKPLQTKWSIKSGGVQRHVVAPRTGEKPAQRKWLPVESHTKNVNGPNK